MLLPLDQWVLAHMLTQMVLLKLQLGLKLQDLNQLENSICIINGICSNY